MIRIWLQTALVVGLALLAWICGIDATGNSTESLFLWMVAGIAGAQLALRFALGAR